MAQEQHTLPPRGSAAWGFLRFLIELLISGIFLGAFVMALYNVFGVSIEVDGLARETACQGQGPTCKAQFTMWERTPIAHSLQMHTPAGTTSVRCQREYILYGPWSCASLDNSAPRGSASVTPTSVTPASASVTPAPLPSQSKPKAAARSR